MTVTRVIVPYLGNHLSENGVSNLLPEDVGQDPAHHQHHHPQEADNYVGQQ